MRSKAGLDVARGKDGRVKMNIEIYTTPTCGYCQQAKRFFSVREVRYAEHDVSRDRAAADEMVRLTG